MAHMLSQQPVTVSCIKPYVSHWKVELHNEVPNSLQGSHRLEKHLNIEGFLEKCTVFLFSGGLNTINGNLIQYKMVVSLFVVAYAAPNKVATILYQFLYPATKVWRGIMLYPSVSVRLSVRPSVRTISDR